MDSDWTIHNPDGTRRVIVTRELPGERWQRRLMEADCRVEIGTTAGTLDARAIRRAVGARCHAVVGQLTENWDAELLAALKAAGGVICSNYAVGYNNVDVAAASRLGIAVGNTPGVLTETTAELAVALTLAAARRIAEAERYTRAGRFKGWAPDLFLGSLLWRRTLGVIGAGRIGSAYARMMVQGHRMDLVYYSRASKPALEGEVEAYADFLAARGEPRVTCRRAGTIEELLEAADVVSLHVPLAPETHHLMDRDRLERMKPGAILVNTSRGPIIDEQALVAHCRAHPLFRAALDVFEDEPRLTPGLRQRPNAVLSPHIGSATDWARQGMALLAALNVIAILAGYPVWPYPDMSPFLGTDPPPAAPSIVNAAELGLGVFAEPPQSP